MPRSSGLDIDAVVRQSLEGEPRVLLAVSGGADSMALLDAAARCQPPGQFIAVATVDHGTGAFATDATAIVAREAALRGLHVRTESLEPDRAGSSEAAWRTARWRFLRSVALADRARIVTAHSRDDQVETVVMRILRGAGARGLAGLYAKGPILRPFLGASRSELRKHVIRRRLPFVDDPTNESTRFLRNRIRRDLLPAIRAIDPNFEEDLLDLARRAAGLRAEVDRIAGEVTLRCEPGRILLVPPDRLAHVDDAGLRLLWQSLAASLGVALDRRGTSRLAHFTQSARVGGRVQFSGGWELVRTRDAFVARRPQVVPARSGSMRLPRSGELSFGAFRFRAVPGASFTKRDAGAWDAVLPADRDLRVRTWAPGDRMVVDSDGAARRVKRFFADAGIAGPLRGGWPVVLVDGEVAWIPGVRRGPQAAHVGRGRGTLFHCEHNAD